MWCTRAVLRNQNNPLIFFVSRNILTNILAAQCAKPKKEIRHRTLSIYMGYFPYIQK
jgi:hypothetical protein